MGATRPKSETKVVGMIIDLKASPLRNGKLKEASEDINVDGRRKGDDDGFTEVELHVGTRSKLSKKVRNRPNDGDEVFGNKADVVSECPHVCVFTNDDLQSSEERLKA